MAYKSYSAAADVLARSDVRGVEMLLTLEEVAQIYRRSPATIKTYLQRGIFSPLPCRKYPYRWKKSDIERDLENAEPDRRYAAHGFATTKKRPAQARLNKTKRVASR